MLSIGSLLLSFNSPHFQISEQQKWNCRFLMRFKKDERVLITDEVLQCQILVLLVLVKAVLQAWEHLVQRVIVL